MHPILFKIGPLAIHSYGVMIMIGFIAAVAWSIREGKRRGITSDQILDVSMALLVGGIIGARALFILLNPSLLFNPSEWLQIWEGGMSFHGSVLGGGIAMAWVCRARNIPLIPLMDTSAPGIALGYGFGRIGCFLAGCCYGGACSLPWAVRFPDAHLPGGFTPPSHPTQIYSSISGFLMFALLAWLSRRQKFQGQMILSFFVLYSAYRFCVEFFRAGVTSSYAFDGLTVTQVASIVIILVSLVVMRWAAQWQKRRDAVAVGAEGGR